MTYSEASDKGHSAVRTQSKNFNVKDKLSSPKVKKKKTLRRGHLTIKDKNCRSQCVLYMRFDCIITMVISRKATKSMKSIVGLHALQLRLGIYLHHTTSPLPYLFVPSTDHGSH